MENGIDKVGIVKELVAEINKKFPTRSDQRELSQALITLKTSKQLFIKRLIETLDLKILNQIESEADLTPEMVTDITYNNLEIQRIKKLNFKDVVMADRAFNILQKISRIIIYYLLNTIPDKRAKIISTIQAGIADVMYIEGENMEDLPADLKLTNLPERFYVDENPLNQDPAVEFYYWAGTELQLEKLYLLLIENRFIEDNPNFLKSFNTPVTGFKSKTIWKGSNRQLVYLVHLILNKHAKITEKVHKIAFKLFKLSLTSEFKPQSLNVAFNHIEDLTRDIHSLSDELREMKMIFDAAIK